MSKDLKIAKKLCEILKKVEELEEGRFEECIGIIIWVLDLLISNEIKTEAYIFYQAFLMLMESRVFQELLLKVNAFTDKTFQEIVYGTVLVLLKFMQSNLRVSNIYERSIFYKSIIVENNYIIVNAAERLCNIAYSFLMLSSAFSIYMCFANYVGDEYCKSMMKSHIKNGAFLKLVKLLSSKHSQANQFQVLEPFSLQIVFTIRLFVVADFNQFYNEPCLDIKDELRLAVPTMAKMISSKFMKESDVKKCCALKTLMVFQHFAAFFTDKADKQLLKRVKLTKNVFDLVCWGMNSNIGIIKTIKLLELSFELLEFMMPIEIKHFSPLIPFLIKAMGSPITEPTSERSLKVVAANFSSLIWQNISRNDTEFIGRLVEMKFIPALVDVLQYYSKSSEIVHLKLSANIIRCLGCLVQEATYEKRLAIIDQAIASLPFAVQYITNRNDINLETVPEADSGSNLASYTAKLFLTIARGLNTVKQDQLSCCIKAQSDAILESGIMYGVGKAITSFKDHDIILEYLNALNQFGFCLGSQKIMDGFGSFLPKIIDRAAELKKSYQCAENKNNVYVEMLRLIRKSLAYCTKDIDSAVVKYAETTHIIPMLSFWASIIISEDRIVVPVVDKSVLNDNDCYFNGVAMAELLKVTWQLCRYYPVIICRTFSSFFCSHNAMFKDCSTIEHKTERIMKLVLDVLASYINYFEEYSTEFLRHITAFVKDLNIDCHEKVCFNLLNACNQFVKTQTNYELVYNISFFTKYNMKDSESKSELYCCSLCTVRTSACKPV